MLTDHDVESNDAEYYEERMTQGGTFVSAEIGGDPSRKTPTVKRAKGMRPPHAARAQRNAAAPVKQRPRSQRPPAPVAARDRETSALARMGGLPRRTVICQST